MEKLFRIKKEAVQYFDKKYAKAVYRLPTWEDCKVSPNALEEVEKVYLVHGIKKSERGSDLSSWSDHETQIHFTIKINDSSYKQHDHFTNEVNVRMLMDKIQYFLNEHFEND